MHKRKFRVTTDSKNQLSIAPNLLDREFNQTTALNQVRVTDITYIPTDECWLYLAAVKGLYTGEIAGWAIVFSDMQNSTIKFLLSLLKFVWKNYNKILHNDNTCSSMNAGLT